jgi:phosphatidylglycerophosphatase A
MWKESSLKDRLIQIAATAGGLGLAPVAPGTFGTLAGIPLVYFFSKINHLIAFLLTFTVVVGAVFVANAYQALRDGHDRQEIVIDEVAGFVVTMAMVPLTWQTWVAGFILFRIFDAVKPWPISKLDEKVKGGLGVVIDDVAAGLVSNLILQILITKTNWLGVQLLSV